MRTGFCPVERFLAIGSADCHWKCRNDREKISTPHVLPIPVKQAAEQ